MYSTNHKRVQHAKANPLQWAILMVMAAALAIVLIGGCRQLLGGDSAYARPNEEFRQRASPPLVVSGPHIPPPGATIVAQAVLTQTLPTSIIVTSTPLPTPLPTSVPAQEPTPSPMPQLPVMVEPTPLPTATAVPMAVNTYQPPQPAMQLSGFQHFWQTWNNCGPATLASNLSYYGSTLDQADIGDVLRRYADDKNVSPEELVAYAQGQGYMAQLRVNGSADLARTLISNGIPLLIETWLEDEPDNGMGHYRLLTGYDDTAQRWVIYDSYVSTNLVNADPNIYQGIYLSYQQTEAWWKIFNRTYVLVYPPDRDALVRSILGDAYDEGIMWQAAIATAQAEIAANPADAYAYFNLGSDLVQMGDYAGAATAFDQARAIGLPWRMLWYQFGPFIAYTQVGRYQEVIDLGQATLTSAAGGIEEIHYWRGRAMASLGDTANAQAEWNQALVLNPDFLPAQQALAGIPY
jgi:tetratricopeptide (TPR) repeat protein